VGGAAGRNGFWQASGGYVYDFMTLGKRESGTLAPTTTGQYVPGERNWSDHATVSAAYGFWLGRLLVAGLYDGFLPVQTGRGYEESAQRAGPRFTYRVDSRVDAFGGSWHTPGGRNSLHYDQFYAGIAFKTTKLGRLQGFLGSDR
jgi:hypothetical protein